MCSLLFQEKYIGFSSLSLLDQLGADCRRFLQRLLLTPFFDIGVMTAEKHVGHGSASEIVRSRILRIFKQSRIGKALLFVAFRVSKNAGEQACDRVDNDASGDFSAYIHEGVKKL